MERSCPRFEGDREAGHFNYRSACFPRGKKKAPMTGEVEIRSGLDRPLILTPEEFTLSGKVTYCLSEIEKGERYRVSFQDVSRKRENYRGSSSSRRISRKNRYHIWIIGRLRIEPNNAPSGSDSPVGDSSVTGNGLAFSSSCPGFFWEESSSTPATTRSSTLFLFAEIVFNYQILPDLLVNLVSLFLPWIELLVGLSLILGIWSPGSVLICTFSSGGFLQRPGLQYGQKVSISTAGALPPP